MGYGKGMAFYVPSLTWQANPRVERVVGRFAADAMVVDLGAGGRRLAPHVKTVDFVGLPGTDYVCDVTATPFPDESVDCVIATGLFEHVERDDKLLLEIRRILRPGGTLHVELPFLQQYHDDPIDMRRYTLPGLASVLRQHGFVPVESGVHIGPTVTILTLLCNYVALLFEGPTLLHKALSHGAFVGFSVIAYPFKYLDRWLIHKRSAHRLAFGVYCTAEKAAAPV